MIEALRMANTEREEANNEKDKLIKQIEEVLIKIFRIKTKCSKTIIKRMTNITVCWPTT